MKRLILAITLLAITSLIACSQDAPGSSSTANEKCNKFGCISIEIDQPIQALKPAKMRIRVSSTQKTDHLVVSLTVLGMESLEIGKLPETTRSVQYRDQGVSVVLEVEADMEYEFEGEVVLAKPSYKAEKHSYSFFLVAVTPTGGIVRTSTSIYLDSEGNQLNTERVRELSETKEEILPEVTGIIIFPTDTPYPTFPPPTATVTVTPTATRTPTPTNTPTTAPYP